MAVGALNRNTCIMHTHSSAPTAPHSPAATGLAAAALALLLPLSQWELELDFHHSLPIKLPISVDLIPHAVSKRHPSVVPLCLCSRVRHCRRHRRHRHSPFDEAAVGSYNPFIIMTKVVAGLRPDVPAAWVIRLFSRIRSLGFWSRQTKRGAPYS